MRAFMRLTALVLAITAFGLHDASAIDAQRLETDDGNSFILVRGTFLPDDDPSILTRMVVARPVAFVTFESPGGNPHAAMRLGREIRRLGLNTVQIKSIECSSACTLAFLGGANRFAEAGALGVHKSSFLDPESLDAAAAVSAVQSLTADIIGYLVEMGADPALLKLALAYESDDMRYLSSREMAEYRVTTVAEAPPIESAATTARSSPAATPPASSKLGTIRHPSGGVMLRATADEDGAEVAAIWNATPVEILGEEGRWYRVRASGRVAYAHETWVKVDGFASAADDRKYIQLFSFSNVSAARSKIATLPFAAEAYEVLNGWIAVTVAGKFSDTEATTLLADGKAADLYPDDAFKTFGNTYVRKVCCE